MTLKVQVKLFGTDFFGTKKQHLNSHQVPLAQGIWELPNHLSYM